MGDYYRGTNSKETVNKFQQDKGTKSQHRRIILIKKTKAT